MGKTLHYAMQADHWTIERCESLGKTFYVINLVDKSGSPLWVGATPNYKKGDKEKRWHKARTFAGTIIANFQSGHRFDVPILENGKPTTCWPDKPERSERFSSEGKQP